MQRNTMRFNDTLNNANQYNIMQHFTKPSSVFETKCIMLRSIKPNRTATYTHARASTHAQTHTHKHTHTHTTTRTHAHTHKHTHTHTHARVNRSHGRTYYVTHARTHTHTHTGHAYAQTLTQKLPLHARTHTHIIYTRTRDILKVKHVAQMAGDIHSIYCIQIWKCSERSCGSMYGAVMMLPAHNENTDNTTALRQCRHCDTA